LEGESNILSDIYEEKKLKKMCVLIQQLIFHKNCKK